MSNTATDIWLAWYPSDYLRDTRHLTCLEHGAYRQLLDAVFCAGGKLTVTDADLPRLLAISEQNWKEIRGRITPFFKVTGTTREQWQHKRVTEEIRKAKQRRKLQRHRTEAAREALQHKRESVTKTVTKPVTTSSTPSPSPSPSHIANSLSKGIAVKGNGEPDRKDWNGMTTGAKLLEILGTDEIGRRPDWITRAEAHPKRIESILDAMRGDMATGRVIKNRGAYAEQLWKITK